MENIFYLLRRNIYISVSTQILHHTDIQQWTERICETLSPDNDQLYGLVEGSKYSTATSN